ncbi:MAG: ANTAR domain-containing protein, partial [Candidatus Omnitrophica bacterium]|nr:ANTAR domain-containing protein [Candidatus Omnitrophota bacterium]
LDPTPSLVGVRFVATMPMLLFRRTSRLIRTEEKLVETAPADVVANQAAVAIENTELMVKTKIIQEELETRKKVEKAKGILMKEQGLPEDDAYKLIRKTSMHKRLSMKEIAEAIILSFEISGRRRNNN